MKFKIIIQNKSVFFMETVRTGDGGKTAIFRPRELKELLDSVAPTTDGWDVDIVENFKQVDPGGKILLKPIQITIF